MPREIWPGITAYEPETLWFAIALGMVALLVTTCLLVRPIVLLRRGIPLRVVLGATLDSALVAGVEAAVGSLAVTVVLVAVLHAVFIFVWVPGYLVTGLLGLHDASDLLDSVPLWPLLFLHGSGQLLVFIWVCRHAWDPAPSRMLRSFEG